MSAVPSGNCHGHGRHGTVLGRRQAAPIAFTLRVCERAYGADERAGRARPPRRSGRRLRRLSSQQASSLASEPATPYACCHVSRACVDCSGSVSRTRLYDSCPLFLSRRRVCLSIRCGPKDPEHRLHVTVPVNKVMGGAGTHRRDTVPVHLSEANCFHCASSSSRV